MTMADDLRAFFEGLDYTLIIAADGETRTHNREDGRIVEQTPAGGVSVAFDVLCQAAGATYIARGRTDADREVLDTGGKVRASGPDGSYALKRLFLSPEEEAAYYAGYSNQTLWPLCHVAFQRPIFNREWFEGYAEVNRKFARSIEEEIDDRSFIWVNDYQLALVPGFLRRPEGSALGLFWHIPWPTWEIFRILPSKREILNSLLACDYIAFHRRYQARNFLNAVDQELGARIDFETNTVHVDGKRVRVGSLPMGIDVDVIRNTVAPEDRPRSILGAVRSTFGSFLSAEDHGEDEPRQSEEPISDLPEVGDAMSALTARYRILLGVDRLDYTKGIPERLRGLDRFFEMHPECRERVVYIGIMSPTRDTVPAYQDLHRQVQMLADELNEKYRTRSWQPLHMVYEGFTREDVMDLYEKASVCLVTPVDDGMNLVSKEFVVAASLSDEPGVLVLSQFAGSATDLSAALIVNPYDPEDIAAAIAAGLEMPSEVRRERIDLMVSRLEEENVYEWAMTFVRNGITAAREEALVAQAQPLRDRLQPV